MAKGTLVRTSTKGKTLGSNPPLVHTSNKGSNQPLILKPRNQIGFQGCGTLIMSTRAPPRHQKVYKECLSTP